MRMREDDGGARGVSVETGSSRIASSASGGAVKSVMVGMDESR